MMLYAGTTHGACVLQEHRWSSRKLGFQSSPPKHTSTICHCHPWRVRRHHHNNLTFPLKIYYSRLILVDSTRAGKRLPDALSKTVPIWCAVVNHAIRLRSLAEASSSDVVAPAAADLNLDFDLRTPPGAVSPHEHAQIAARLDSWAVALAVSHPPPPLCRLTLLSPSSGSRAHRIRRMHCPNWPGRCARCGLRPRLLASRTSPRTDRRSCLLYA